jgi:hypothetical protein
MDDWKDAIMDYVLAAAFTEGTLRGLMHDLWDHAYTLGYHDGRDSWAEEYNAQRFAEMVANAAEGEKT